ncbi:2-dehydro-3-deoxygluconokinase [Pullulanibacillus camelliae]|uniref:2-dehydro-3-deoxygluconokinase n=1 Tax=Pullulanibacillus camelliae TaxID=1707096 RepID=A0A8J2YDR0_9BACL|nr:sugar kinase [Pullulanibacillus camelliae]GGE26945.1 2-dehydro-3-deoxygluconokinase [Pullulanibacillus camelliae]
MAKIAAFGEVMMRLQVPGYDLLSQSNTLHYTFSGTGVNVASALTRLGHDGCLVTTLPENPIGDAAMSFIQKLGIDLSFTVREGNALGMYFLENGFGPRPSRVTYSNRLESSFNTASPGIYDVEALASTIDAIHFCGIALAMNDTVRQHITSLVEAVKAKGGRIIFDCNYRPSLWGENGYKKARPYYEHMLTHADIVMMNEKDAMLILGMQTDETQPHEQLQELIPRVAHHYNISLIAGTHRSIHTNNTHTLQGYLFKEQSFAFSQPLTFSVYDRIGAGDAFVSGIVHGEYQGFSPEKTIMFATAAAMLAHTVTGDTPMSSEHDIFQAMTASLNDVER